jgi:hypothetical protein
MVRSLISRFTSWVQRGWPQFQRRVLRWTQPAQIPLAVGTKVDLARSRTQLMLENMVLRQQRVRINEFVPR